jgi:hypothetical protein
VGAAEAARRRRRTKRRGNSRLVTKTQSPPKKQREPSKLRLFCWETVALAKQLLLPSLARATSQKTPLLPSEAPIERKR